MPRVGSEPTIPVFERAKKVHALDRAANVIDSLSVSAMWMKTGAGSHVIVSKVCIVYVHLISHEDDENCGVQKLFISRQHRDFVCEETSQPRLDNGMPLGSWNYKEVF
jgi:hypothetical protein